MAYHVCCFSSDRINYICANFALMLYEQLNVVNFLLKYRRNRYILFVVDDRHETPIIGRNKIIQFHFMGYFYNRLFANNAISRRDLDL